MSDLAATILATSIAFSAFFVGYVRLLRDSVKEMNELSREIAGSAESAQAELDELAKNTAVLSNGRRRGGNFDLSLDLPEPSQDLAKRGGDVLKG